jgi:hypothetical protein
MSSSDRIWQVNASCGLADILTRSLREFYSLLHYVFVPDSGSRRVQVAIDIARNKWLNAMRAQRQRESQDCYAALVTRMRWFIENHCATGN